AADLARAQLRSNDGSPEILKTYARSLSRLGRDDSAWMIYNNRLKVDQMEGEDYLLLGGLLFRRNQLEPAFEVWTKGVKLAPEHPELLDQFARLAIRLQRLDRAADASKRLAKLPGWEARGSFLSAEVASLLDDPKGVVDEVRRGFTADPSAKGASLPVLEYRLLLARNLLRLHRPDEAAKALAPLSGASDHTESTTSLEVHWLLSRAYLQQGRPAEALAEGKQSGTYRADNPITFEPAPYLGEASCASCHPKESREHAGTRHARTFHHGAGLRDLPIP
ncbi:tetratricopeptide repeat protein, partial [Singulisphaera rosea]